LSPVLRVERTRHFGGLNHLGDRQSEYRNDRGIAYLADEFRPEGNQHLCQGLAIVQLRALGIEPLGRIDAAQLIDSTKQQNGEKPQKR